MHCGDFSLFEGGAKTPSPACDLESLGRGNGVYFLFSLLIDSRLYYGVKNYSSYTPEIFQQKQRGILFCKLFPMQRIKAFAFFIGFFLLYKLEYHSYYLWTQHILKDRIMLLARCRRIINPAHINHVLIGSQSIH